MYMFAFDVNQCSIYVETEITYTILFEEKRKLNNMQRLLFVSSNSCVTRRKRKTKTKSRRRRRKSSIKE